LFEYQFQRVDFVTEPGEFSVRGGIVDVFSFSNDEPYRIEFFGDEVDSIRTFDVATQLSTDQIKKITIIPNVENKAMQETRESFLKYIASKTIVFAKDIELLSARIDKNFEKAKETFKTLSENIKHATPEELFAHSDLIKKQLLDFTLVEIGNRPLTKADYAIKFETKPQPSFNKQFDLLIKNLNENYSAGYKNYIFCVSEQQAKRFHDIFDDADLDVKQYETIVFSAFQGFI